jgi:hypothetical protein
MSASDRNETKQAAGPASALPPSHPCRACKKETDGTKRCSACSAAVYCNKECQTADFKAGHKRSCARLPARLRGIRFRLMQPSKSAESSLWTKAGERRDIGVSDGGMCNALFIHKKPYGDPNGLTSLLRTLGGEAQVPLWVTPDMLLALVEQANGAYDDKAHLVIPVGPRAVWDANLGFGGKLLCAVPKSARLRTLLTDLEVSECCSFLMETPPTIKDQRLLGLHRELGPVRLLFAEWAAYLLDESILAVSLLAATYARPASAEPGWREIDSERGLLLLGSMRLQTNSGWGLICDADGTQATVGGGGANPDAGVCTPAAEVAPGTVARPEAGPPAEPAAEPAAESAAEPVPSPGGSGAGCNGAETKAAESAADYANLLASANPKMRAMLEPSAWYEAAHAEAVLRHRQDGRKEEDARKLANICVATTKLLPDGPPLCGCGKRVLLGGKCCGEYHMG